MRTLVRFAAVLVLFLIAANSVWAQQSGRFYYADAGGRLDRAQVEAAARPLLDKGAYVAVYAVERGKGTDFLAALDNDGLRNGSTVNPNLIAIFVSFGDRYSEIRYGDKWVDSLGAANAAGSIQDGTLNPGLAGGDFTDTFVKTLSALNRTVDLRGVPTGDASTPPPASTTGGVGILGWIAGLLALIGIPVGWNTLSKRRAASQALDTARKGMQDARMQAGAAIADTGQLLRNSQEKAQFDKVSYPAGDATSLAELQASAEQQFNQAQESFNTAEEAITGIKIPGVAEYQTSAATYTQIVGIVTSVREVITQAEERRAELDKQNAAAPGQIDAAKKALADVAERLGVLGSDAQPELITRPIAALIGRADALFAERRAADALQAAQVASAATTELSGAIDRFSAIHEGISQARAEAEQVVAQGFRVEDGLKALNTAEGVLSQAARALEDNGAPAALPLLEQAEAARVEGSAQAGELPALYATNTQRILALRQEHVAVTAYLDEGRRTFDIVDEFAERTWSDIRGNGSEAEAATAEAGQRLESAELGNTMETQQFHAVRQNLDTTTERLAFARKLIDTIIQRLKDLEAARVAARDEVAAAEKDIEAGWAFVRTNDADVAKGPEQTLMQAAGLLKQAQEELTQQRPDWIVIVKTALEANRLADESLINARSEVDAISKLRDQLQRAQQLAVGEIQKVQQFVAVHSADLPPDAQRRAAALQNDVQLAANAAQSVAQQQEAARVAALRDANAQYAALHQRIETIFQELYNAFQQAEDRRRRVSEALESARNAIASADREWRNGGGMISNNSQGIVLLHSAQAQIARIGEVHDEQQMQHALQEASAAKMAAGQAESIFHQEIQHYRQQQRDSGQELVKGVIIGSLLSGGGHSSGGSWGGGSSGSSSGGSWGSGGSSGGSSWGGGGSSGGKGW